jgi:hypothetical protein
MATVRVVGPWSPEPDPDAGPASDAGTDEPPADPVVLALTEVVRLDHAGPYEQFRATFVGPRETPLDQGTFVLDPAPAGLEALLLVPTAERDDGRVYTASMSVRRPSTESAAP